MRNAVSLGGDADTLAAIAGALGEALHGPARRARRDGQDAVPARRRGHHGSAGRALRERSEKRGVRHPRRGAEPSAGLPARPARPATRSGASSSSRTPPRYERNTRKACASSPTAACGAPSRDSRPTTRRWHSALARSLVRNGKFSIEDVRASYVRWHESGPFDIGHTTRCGLDGHPMLASQGNGALMRISPLGIFWLEDAARGARRSTPRGRRGAHAPERDLPGRSTGPTPQRSPRRFVKGHSAAAVYEGIAARAADWKVDAAIRERYRAGPDAPACRLQSPDGMGPDRVPQRAPRAREQRDARGRGHRDGCTAGATPTPTRRFAARCSVLSTAGKRSHNNGWSQSPPARRLPSALETSLGRQSTGRTMRSSSPTTARARRSNEQVDVRTSKPCGPSSVPRSKTTATRPNAVGDRCRRRRRGGPTNAAHHPEPAVSSRAEIRRQR